MGVSNHIASDGLTVLVSPAFAKYMEAAALRLGGQFPSLFFCKTELGMTVSGALASDEIALREAVLDAVYREKIYAETLDMRRALVNTVTES